MTPKTESNFGIAKRDRGRSIGRLTLVTFVAAIFCFLSATSAYAAWYNSSWQYRKKLTIDYTKVGATLSSFPVLVSLGSDSDLAARARSDGYDILFTSSDGTTKLDHEIERYTSGTGALVAWVRIPSLSNSADTEIYMYYGNASASNQQNKNDVWSNSYAGVWHLSNNDFTDSTSNANNGTNSGTTDATGQIAGGRQGNASNNYIRVADHASLTPSDDMTFSIWVRLTSLTYTTRLVQKEHNASPWQSYIVFVETSGTLIFGWINSGGAYEQVASSSGAITTGTWYHITGVRNSGTLRIYLNGTDVSSSTVNTTGTIFDSNTFMTMGNNGNFNSFPAGIIDEVRLASAGRSAEWIATEYNNQSDPGPGTDAFFKSLGSEETESISSAYAYRRAITIDGDQIGSSCSSSLTDFPVLISITGEDYLKTAPTGNIQSSDGYDIIFKDGDGNQLDHEVEKYDGTAGTLVAWVRIPTLVHNDDTVIYMYYGNSSISSATENPTGVWDNNYLSVWHLDGSLSDSNNGHDLANSNTTAAETGKIGPCREFGGDGDYLEDSDAENYINGLTAITVSAWIKSDDLGTDQGVFNGIPPDDADEYMGLRYDAAGYEGGNTPNVIKYGIRIASPNGMFNESSANVQTTSWQHVTMRWSSGNNLELYINGALDTPTWLDPQNPGSGSIIELTTFLIGKGGKDDQAGEGWDGLIDEVRILSTVRDQCWIQTEYNNQNSPSSFYTVGSEEPLNFNYYKPLTIQSSMMGTSCGTSGVTEFPLLISLSGVTDIKTVANGGHVQSSSGYDIIFKDASGVKLDHEIERYDGSAGDLVAWVRVPVISGTTNTALYMYYGNSNVTSSTENKTGVWDSNYKGVWHLEEAVTNNATLAGAHDDSTSNNNDGSQMNNDDVSAKIYNGQDFEGDARDEYVEIPNSTFLENVQEGDYTIEAWFYSDTEPPGTDSAAWNSAYAVVVKNGYHLGIMYRHGNYFQMHHWLTGDVDEAISSGVKSNTSWYHVVGVVSKTDGYVKLYVNGEDEGTTTFTAGTAAREYGTTPWRFGIATTGRGDWAYPANGKIDEVRISDTARSACWIETEYKNQGTPGTYIDVGAEVAVTDVSLANHAAGQESDKFTSASSVTGAELFAFKLTNNIASGVTVDQVQFQLSSVTGIAQGDFANLAIYVDANNDGTIGAEETTTVGGTGAVDAGVASITFTGDFTISASTTVNYILKGDVSNLAGRDTITIALGTSNVTLVSGTIGGSAATNVTHTADAVGGLTQIHYRWRNDDGSEGGLDTGTGADGAATITASPTNINTAVIGSNRSTNADGIVTTVTANPTGSSVTVTSTTGFAGGDEILLINMQGALGDTADVGNYEFLRVASVPNGTTLNLTSSVQKSYDGASFANQKVVVQRVPQWTNVTIQSGGTLTANDWNGTSGGVIIFRATGTVDVQSGGAISANALGYRGGAGGTTGGGVNGESYDGGVGSGGNDVTDGPGGGNAGTSGGGGSSNYAASSPGWNRGGGGGGGNTDGNTTDDGAGGAGGGGYGGGGGGGGGGGDGNTGGSGGSGGATDVNGGGGGMGGDNQTGFAGGNAGSAGNGTYPGAVGSGTISGGGGGSPNTTSTGIGAGGGGGGGNYGAAALTTLFLGSGGGGGGGHDNGPSAGATGGDGGGIIYIIANTLTVSGSITSNGANGGTPSAARAGSSGGGSGGSILMQADSATLGSSLVSASGGSGGAAQTRGGGGGAGGVGRIRIEADSISGTTSPSASTSGTPGGTGASWAADQDTKLNEAIPGKIYRLRFMVANMGTGSSGTVTYKLQVAQTDDCGSGDYADVPTDDTGPFKIINSTYLTDGGATTDVVSGLTNEATTFVPGQVKDTSNTTGSITLNTDQFTELEFAITAVDHSDYFVPGANYCFRLVSASGTSMSTYSVYAEIGTSACQYLYRKPLTIDYTKLGSSCGSSGVTEFPVLISMSGVTDIKTTAYGGHVQSSNGDDIIFRASNGVDGLYHEIESYDGSTGTLIAWVRVPMVSGTADTTIYMYYGNACILSPTESPTNVWDSSYQAVWHLKETTGGTDAIKDSTGNTRHGTDVGSPTLGATGEIDGAVDFGKPNTTRRVDTKNFMSSGVTQFTAEAWVYKTEAKDARIIYKNNAGNTGHPVFGLASGYVSGVDTIRCRLRISDGSGTDYNVGSISLNTWTHVACTYDGSNVRAYKNGQEAGFTPETGTLAATNDVVVLAQNEAGTSVDRHWPGRIDEARVSNIARSACWIQTEYNNMNWPNKTDYPSDGFVTIGAEQGAAAPTAVSLLSFKATGDGGDVVVAWTTAQEINNFGFHVYRSESVGGPFTRITDRLIPGLTFSVRGRDYTYVDRNVTRGSLYYYKLEDIDMDGTRTMHGPVCVDWDGDGIPDDWELRYGFNPAVDDSGLDPDGDGLTNLQEYYRNTNPLQVDTDGDGVRDSQEYFGSVTEGLTRGVEVITSDAAGITLELRTESFESVVLDEGGVSYRRLRVPEYVHGYTEAVGKPELPVKGILLDLPAGYGGTLSIESVESLELSNYWIYPVPEKVLSGEGETVTEVFVIDDEAYRTDSFYPDVVAGVGETYDYRGQKKLQVFFNPFSFNPVTGELIQYTRIRVRVEYVALAEEEPVVRSGVPVSAPESSLARSVAWVPPEPASAYKMAVLEEGMYRVTSVWLTSHGVSVSDWSQVRVYNLGQEIPTYQGADYVEFYGTAPTEAYSKYTKHNVYWLTTSGGSGTPLRMGTIDGTPGAGSIPTTHVYTVSAEEDTYYMGQAPGAESLDRWVSATFAYGSGVAGGGPVNYRITLPGVGGTRLGQVTVLLCGATTLDHDVEIAMNGLSLGTYQWSGVEFYEVSFSDVPLLDGANTMTLTCLSGSDPANPDGVGLDWVEVAYPRKYEANGNVLKITHNAGYRYQIGNFSSNTIQAYDITTPADVKRITNVQVTGTNPYTLTMEPGSGSGERTYIVLSSSAVKTPVSITKDTAGNLSGTGNGADYILITHRDLGWDAGGAARPWLANLKAHREAEGLRVKAVDVEDIYDEFSYGILSPQGIKDFLSYTYQNWTSPAPQYVLLVGDSVYDPKDNYGLETINYVPTYLAQTPFMGESLTDEWYVRISGNDTIADMDIGRLPASTTAQAEMMVNKIITYENTPVLKTWERNTLLVADNQVEGYEVLFELMNEDAAGLLPAGMNAPFREYLNDYVNPADLTNSMRNRLNVDGALIWNYSGHGSIQIWANENIFSTGTVATLNNSGKLPFVVAMTCLNGFFGYPEVWAYPSLAEVLLRDGTHGAVAAFMSTGMTEPEGQRVLDQALFEGIFKRDYRTLGRAISYAKQELVANSVALGEVGKTFLLFGDPAMKLKVPLPTAPTAPAGQVSGQSVTLSWGASVDANGGAVAGYNVYRSTTPNGPYTKVNSALITNNGYTDSSVQVGTYYYVVKSVDGDGYESPSTLEMTVTIGARSVGGSGFGGGGGGCFISAIAN